jgi:hypothetical protein
VRRWEGRAGQIRLRRAPTRMRDDYRYAGEWVRMIEGVRLAVFGFSCVVRKQKLHVIWGGE